MTTEIISGLLYRTIPSCNRSTIQHADEIQRDRYNDKNNDADLPFKDFVTADFPMYTVEDNEAVLYIARGKDNLIFDDIEFATKYLKEKFNYPINHRESIDSVINAVTTLRIVLSDLNLQGIDSEYKYFEINPEKYDDLNKAQRAFAERVHGTGKAFKDSMEMLRMASIESSTIFVLNPDYIKNKVYRDEAIARVCNLNSLGTNSDFNALDKMIWKPYSSIRGELKNKGE